MERFYKSPNKFHDSIDSIVYVIHACHDFSLPKDESNHGGYAYAKTIIRSCSPIVTKDGSHTC